MNNAEKMDPIAIQPIGIVEAEVAGVMGSPDYDKPCVIHIFPQYIAGFAGVEKFSHFHVIYHQNKASEWKKERHWPEENPLVVPPPDPRAGDGVFTIRAPCRPACLGSSVVKFVSLVGTKLTVVGLDALDGTPVMDIKIYHPQFDSFPEAKIPSGWKPGMQKKYQTPESAGAK